MAMDFFESQDAARRRTGLLVLLLALAVAAIVVLVYVAVVVILGLTPAAGDPVRERLFSGGLWHPQLLATVGLGTVVLVGGASLYKMKSLSGGGASVAALLGGRRVEPESAIEAERRLLNVVEEMSIASGTPVPPVYVIEERGINAFAAGHSTDDAIIGVTRGTIETLSRDELQGVIAHEFSHILQGDMRLNIRLMGVVYGIVVIGLVGSVVLRGAAAGASSSSRRREGGGGALVLLALGAALIAIGGVGTFFAKLIKSAVSRQREYLADAAAVQFTRNPSGIAGALKKIGGWARRGELSHPQSEEIAHMLFAARLRHSLAGIFATHPPLEKRIKAIEPEWSGEYPDTRASGAAPVRREASEEAEPAPELRGKPWYARVRPRGGEGGGGGAVDGVGNPTGAHLEHARHLLLALPAMMRRGAHEPFTARALVYALLIDPDERVAERQMRRLEAHADGPTYEHARRLLPRVRELDRRQRLPLVDLALPALRELSGAQYESFKSNVSALVSADERLSVFEWSLQRVLMRHLSPHFEKAVRSRARIGKLERVGEAVSVLLSTLAYAGHDRVESAESAFGSARAVLGDPGWLELKPVEACGLGALSEALDRLDGLRGAGKRQLLEAASACVGADRQVTGSEGELLRAISDGLGCPMPPVLQGQSPAATQD